ncbi:RDD family protein [Nocardioides sp. MH1]|uniref:RDD family protein n=1 Tax=Nocardioides sp. MH1 TaxID=3242490 RepID=UPI0035201D12
MSGPTVGRPAPAPGEVPFPTASWARRVLALIVDWTASTGLVLLLVGTDKYGETGSPAQAITLGVYIVEAAVFTWLFGGSLGKLVTGLRVVPAKGYGRLSNLVPLLLRQVLIALVIPPLVFRNDGRGVHDLVAGTATVTMDTYRMLRTTGVPRR